MSVKASLPSPYLTSVPRQQTFAVLEKEKLKKGAKSCEKRGGGECVWVGAALEPKAGFISPWMGKFK